LRQDAGSKAQHGRNIEKTTNYGCIRVSSNKQTTEIQKIEIQKFANERAIAKIGSVHRVIVSGFAKNKWMHMPLDNSDACRYKIP
jgi:hypothetical protein